MAKCHFAEAIFLSKESVEKKAFSPELLERISTGRSKIILALFVCILGAGVISQPLSLLFIFRSFCSLTEVFHFRLHLYTLV